MVCVRFRRWVKQKKKQASKSCNEGGQLVLLQLEKEKKKKTKQTNVYDSIWSKFEKSEEI